MNHWFVAFLYRRSGDDRWHPEDVTTRGEHPLDYMARARLANDGYEYRLLFFREIPEDVFKRVHPGAEEPGAVPTQTVR